MNAADPPVEAALAEAADRLKDALARLVALVEPFRVELWARNGLTVGQLRLVHALRTMPGASTGEVATAMGTAASSLTGLVDRVAALGLVRREADARDRRVTRLWLSDEGDRLLRELESEGGAELDRVLARLVPERRLLLADLLQEFVSAAEAERAASPPGAPD